MRAILVLLLCAAGPARADGLSATVGGGVTDFTDSTMHGTALMWAARAVYGTHDHVAIEAAYLGTGTSVPHGGSLEGETIEATLRVQPLPSLPWSPYAFAGFGYQRYTVVGATMPTDLAHSGASIPAGAGVEVRVALGVVVDVRGTYRAFAPFDAWEGSVAVGVEL